MLGRRLRQRRREAIRLENAEHAVGDKRKKWGDSSGFRSKRYRNEQGMCISCCSFRVTRYAALLLFAVVSLLALIRGNPSCLPCVFRGYDEPRSIGPVCCVNQGISQSRIHLFSSWSLCGGFTIRSRGVNVFVQNMVRQLEDEIGKMLLSVGPVNNRHVAVARKMTHPATGQANDTRHDILVPKAWVSFCSNSNRKRCRLLQAHGLAKLALQQQVHN